MQFDKPGCFGNAITYSVRSSTCTACEAASECAPQARQRIEELKTLISVEAILKMSHKPTQTPAGVPIRFDADLPPTAQKLIAMMPLHAQRTAAQALRLKVNFRKSLLEGVNPIPSQKPLALSVLFDLLLLGAVDHQRYMLDLKERLGHSPAVAADQAAIGYAVATGLGVARLVDGKLEIRK